MDVSGSNPDLGARFSLLNFMDERSRPRPLDNQPIDIGRARERRDLIAREKGRVMRGLLDLSEEETKKVYDLILFGDLRFYRDAFVEKEETHLHEVDELDETVAWLNEGRDISLKELQAGGVTPETLKVDLDGIVDKFVTFVNKLNGLQEIQIDIAAWRQEQKRLIDELYERIRVQTSAEGLSEEQESQFSELSVEIRQNRISLVAAVREAFGIEDEEWMDYINEHA